MPSTVFIFTDCSLYSQIRHKYNYDMNFSKKTNDYGAVSGSLIAIITLSVLLIGMASFAIWSFVNYNEQKTDVDGKIALAEAEAKRSQAEEDEKKFAEREKNPNRIFVGPEDYGRLTFNYPKTWSAFVERDAARGGSFVAYLHKDVIQPISSNQQYMLRVQIDSSSYDEAIGRYESRVEKGQLKSSTASFNGNTAARFDGSFNDNIRGAAIVFKLRDKTVTLQTDADQFKPDFDAIVQTIDFNK